MKAAAYTRVSTEDQASEGTSLDTQAERCKAFAAAQGWDLERVYTDAGVSGALASRPALDRLLAAVRAGQVDVIIVAKLDRLGRSMRNLTPLVGELDDLGVSLVSIAEGFDSQSPSGRLMRNILASFAEHEREVIRDRMRAGVRARVAEGGWGGGQHAPYGYRIDGRGSSAKLVVEPHEAEMIRVAVGLAVDHGLSCGAIAGRLNGLGLLPRSASWWTSTNVRNMLNRGQFDGVWTFGKPSGRSKKAAAPVVVQVEPIVTPQRMAQLQSYLKLSSLTRSTGEGHPLSGRIFCPCGSHMTGIARGDRANRRYRCRNGRHEAGRPFCSLPSLLADPVDDAVWQEVLALLTDPAALQAAAREHVGMLSVAVVIETDALEAAHSAVEAARKALSSATARCVALELDEATTRQTLDTLTANYQAALSQQRMVAEMNESTVARRERVTKVEQVAAIAREQLVNADKQLRAHVLALLDVRVSVLDHGSKTEPVKLKVEGSIAHDVLLRSNETEPAPAILASAAA